MWSVVKQSLYAYLEITFFYTVSTFSNRTLAHTLYHLPICTIMFPIAFRPSPVTFIPNVRSFCCGDGDDGGGLTIHQLSCRTVFIAFTYSSTRAVSFAGSFTYRRTDLQTYRPRNDMLLLLHMLHTLGRSCIYISFFYYIYSLRR